MYNTSKAIYEKEGGDIFIVEMCALLHDVGDWKFSNDNKTETGEIKDLLENLQVEKSDRDKIINIIKKISFKGGIVDSSQECIEGKRIAKERHKFMENYLNEFFLEWNFAKDK